MILLPEKQSHRMEFVRCASCMLITDATALFRLPHYASGRLLPG